MKKTASLTAIVLAAGKGTRMVSDIPKVLHPVAGRPMLHHVLHSVSALRPQQIVTVIAPKMDAVKASVTAAFKHVEFAVQQKQLGTGHAVQSALATLRNTGDAVLVLYGDTPLITEATLTRMVDTLRSDKKNAVVVLGMRPEVPAAYGRLVVNKAGTLEAIVEYKDATAAERTITLCNSGVMAIAGDKIASLLSRLTNKNAKKEFYLTDIIALARKDGSKCQVVEAEESEVLGVNSRNELAEAERIMQQRLRRQAMENGVTLLDPDSTYFACDTRIGKDTVIHPQVYFGSGVTIGSNVLIRSFCHIEGATIADNAIVGPFARLRPGATLGEQVHIGNFVEVKNSIVAQSAKINHLSYIGDAHIGENANIGAGTITCNYDGFNKFKTEIGANALIGSNTALVAPVRIGKDAIIGAGSVITKDVAAEALALTRAPHTEKKHWAKAFRSKQSKKAKH